MGTKIKYKNWVTTILRVPYQFLKFHDVLKVIFR